MVGNINGRFGFLPRKTFLGCVCMCVRVYVFRKGDSEWEEKRQREVERILSRLQCGAPHRVQRMARPGACSHKPEIVT